jgi:hypothetical protein
MISILKKIYLLIVIILALLVIADYFLNGLLQAAGILGTLLFFSYYIGLKNKQPWVIPVIVLTASLGLIGELLTDTTNVAALVVKLFVVAFSCFEIYFFTRKEVQNYFGVKGIFLF